MTTTNIMQLFLKFDMRSVFVCVLIDRIANRREPTSHPLDLPK